MQTKHFTERKLRALLLEVRNGVPYFSKAIESYEQGLVTMLCQFFEQSTCSLQTFCTLLIGFYLLDDLRKDRFQVRTEEQPSNIEYRRELDASDIDELINMVAPLIGDLIKEVAKICGTKRLSFTQRLELVENSELHYSRGQTNHKITHRMMILVGCLFHKIDIPRSLLANVRRVNDLIALTINNTKQPGMFSYQQLHKRWNKMGRPGNQIYMLCESGDISAYLKVSKDNLYVGITNPYLSISLFKRQSTVEKKSYPLHYKGLERLKPNKCPFNFDLETMFDKDFLKRKSYSFWQFESTDIEIKFNIERTFGNRDVVKKNELRFIEEEVLWIESNIFARGDVKTETIEDDSLQPLVSHKDIELTITELPAKSRLQERLHNELKSIQDSQKPRERQKTQAKAIKIILNILFNRDDGFNKDEMPGTVKQFYSFCCTIAPQIFRCGHGTFHSYCKGKKNRWVTSALCTWTTPSYEHATFWQNAFNDLKLG